MFWIVSIVITVYFQLMYWYFKGLKYDDYENNGNEEVSVKEILIYFSIFVGI